SMRQSPLFYSRCKHVLTLARKIGVVAVSFIAIRHCLAQEGSGSEHDRNFSLLEGHGIPVCEAYLELLNKTKFEVTPFCGRPDEGPVKGFEHLDGHFMNVEEIMPLFTKVWEFVRFGDQTHAEKFFHPS